MDQFPVLEDLEKVAIELKGTSNWNNPLAWRSNQQLSGITALDLPKSLGGAGLPVTDIIEWFKVCGAYDLDLRDVPGLGHGRLLLGGQASPRLGAYLQQVATGEIFVAVALTEPQAGSDLRGITTTASRVEGGYRLTGHKRYIARLEQAQIAVVFAKVQGVEDADSRLLTAFTVPLDTQGLRLQALRGAGLAGVSWGELHLDDVFITDEMRLGEEGDGFALFHAHFTYWRVMMSAAAVGCAQSALIQAVDWLRRREAFGGLIGRFTHLQQELARHHTRLEMAWMLVTRAAWKIEREGASKALVEGAQAKAEAVEIALEAVDWAMRIHGAQGYSNELDLEKRMRDLLGLRVADGPTDVLRGQIARSILGNELYEMSLRRKPKKGGDK